MRLCELAHVVVHPGVPAPAQPFGVGGPGVAHAVFVRLGRMRLAEDGAHEPVDVGGPVGAQQLAFQLAEALVRSSRRPASESAKPPAVIDVRHAPAAARRPRAAPSSPPPRCRPGRPARHRPRRARPRSRRGSGRSCRRPGRLGRSERPLPRPSVVTTLAVTATGTAPMPLSISLWTIWNGGAKAIQGPLSPHTAYQTLTPSRSTKPSRAGCTVSNGDASAAGTTPGSGNGPATRPRTVRAAGRPGALIGRSSRRATGAPSFALATLASSASSSC